MITVAEMIQALQKFPPNALCYAYEGEITGVVVVNGDGDELGYVSAPEGDQ